MCQRQYEAACRECNRKYGNTPPSAICRQKAFDDFQACRGY